MKKSNRDKHIAKNKVKILKKYNTNIIEEIIKQGRSLKKNKEKA